MTLVQASQPVTSIALGLLSAIARDAFPLTLLEPNKKAPLPFPVTRLFVWCAPCLLTDAKFGDQCTVTIEVFLLEVGQVTAALTYEAQQRFAAAVVLTVRLEVIAEFLDTVGKEGNLSFSGAGIRGVTTEFCEDFFFLLFGEINWHS